MTNMLAYLVHISAAIQGRLQHNAESPNLRTFNLNSEKARRRAWVGACDSEATVQFGKLSSPMTCSPLSTSIEAIERRKT